MINNNNFNLTWGKIFFIIIFLLYFIYLINYILIYWSWFLFIRILFISLILILFTYKICQKLLSIYKIYLNIYILDKIYNLIFELNNLRIWYNQASEEIDNIYIPTNLLKIKLIKKNKWFNLIIFFLFIIILINHLYPFLFLNLVNFWIPCLLILIQYSLFMIYIDYIYIYPNILLFQKTHSLFFPEGYGLPKFNWRKLLFDNSIKGRGLAHACMYCCLMCAGACWVSKEFYPNNKSFCEQFGDHTKTYQKIRNIVETILPPIGDSKE
jgi:hypothetical protein